MSKHLMPLIISLTSTLHRLCSPRMVPDILRNNAEPHFSAVLVLDTSHSMNELVNIPGREPFRPIDRLNESFAAFPDYLQNDELVAQYAELAVIRCGDGVTVAQDFVKIGQLETSSLQANGDTPLAEAVVLSIQMINDRQRQMERWDLDVLRPFVFVITDGCPTDSRNMLNAAEHAIRKMEAEKLIAFFAAAPEGSPMSQLEKMFVRRPMPLCEFNYPAMFRWFADSIRIVTHSCPGQEVTFPKLLTDDSSRP